MEIPHEAKVFGEVATRLLEVDKDKACELFVLAGNLAIRAKLQPVFKEPFGKMEADRQAEYN